MGAAWERHAMCESTLRVLKNPEMPSHATFPMLLQTGERPVIFFLSLIQLPYTRYVHLFPHCSSRHFALRLTGKR